MDTAGTAALLIAREEVFQKVQPSPLVSGTRAGIDGLVQRGHAHFLSGSTTSGYSVIKLANDPRAKLRRLISALVVAEGR
ncbi:hypothetical protein AVEN_270552-1 [Araneus ventricosus]|uniref:Uncharacterized protein n=1 Tax=Araneus ventricosus TaxID=182803 RepID=A0A4Y2B4N1_ARAVE|nr:hypothetical protein AVEN_270552-1 [Araneus ventricosus]